MPIPSETLIATASCTPERLPNQRSARMMRLAAFSISTGSPVASAIAFTDIERSPAKIGRKRQLPGHTIHPARNADAYALDRFLGFA